MIFHFFFGTSFCIDLLWLSASILAHFWSFWVLCSYFFAIDLLVFFLTIFLLIFDQKWLPFRAKGRSLFGSFFTPCPQGFPFMILVSFRLPFGQPFGSMLVGVGIFLAQFCYRNPPFRRPSPQSTCISPLRPSSKEFFVPRPHADHRSRGAAKKHDT